MKKSIQTSLISAVLLALFSMSSWSSEVGRTVGYLQLKRDGASIPYNIVFDNIQLYQAQFGKNEKGQLVAIGEDPKPCISKFNTNKSEFDYWSFTKECTHNIIRVKFIGKPGFPSFDIQVREKEWKGFDDAKPVMCEAQIALLTRDGKTTISGIKGLDGTSAADKCFVTNMSPIK
jgi:hypothetical protein